MSTLTTLLGLKKHADGEFGWGQSLRDLMDTVDTMLGTEHNTDGSHGDINADSIKVGGVNVGATDSGTATSVGALDITQTGKLWATNVFSTGHTVTYQSGGNDAVADIASNDADSLTLAGGSAAPDAATPFSIYGNGDPTIDQAIANSSSGAAAIMQNLLPANFAEVWSNSQGLYDPATDALPVVGNSLCLTPDFASDTNWTKGANWTIAAGVASAAAAVTALEQNVSVTKDQTYEITFTISNYVGGGVKAYVEGAVLGVERAANGTFSVMFVAAATGAVAFGVFGSTAATLDVDDIILTVVTPGIVAGANGPDGWTFGGVAAPYLRENWLNGNIADGTAYGLKATSQAGGISIARIDLANHPALLSLIRGKTITFAIYSETSTAAATNISINIVGTGGGVQSTVKTGTAREWLELTYNVPVDATGGTIDLRNLVDAGNSVNYWSQAILAFGSSIGEGNYVPPTDPWVEPDKSIPLADLNNDTVSADAAYNLEAQSSGMIPKGANVVDMLFKGNCATINKTLRVIDDAAGTNAGPFIVSQVVNQTVTDSGTVKVTPDGEIYVNRDDTFNNIFATIKRIKVR